jgi:DNA-binding CsgD family transcriptional regulator
MFEFKVPTITKEVTIDCNKEIWKEFKNTGYLISNKGNVKGLQGRIIQLSKNGKGYLGFRLYKNGVAKSKVVHSLVAEIFIDNPENKPQVHHIDEDKMNNSINNLKWVTGKEHLVYNMDLGSIPKGENHNRAILTELDVTRILSDEFKDKSNEEVAKIFNVHSRTIYSIRIGKNWKHLDLPRSIKMPKIIQTEESHIARSITAAKGSNHGLAVLDEDSVKEILELFKLGLTNKQIAIKMNVCRSTIYDIRIGKNWQHISGGTAREKSEQEKSLKKITVDSIPIIRSLSADGISNSEIGKMFNVHNGTIHSIISGKTWKNY